MIAALVLIGIGIILWSWLYERPAKLAAGRRKYKSGTGWCVWRWTDVDSEYILRLHVVKTPWFAVCLHWIRKPDAEPWLHDHPVSFLSLVLRGKYAEVREIDGLRFLKVNSWFNFIRASREDRHRIVFCRKNTLTLCFMGPKTREWGFHTTYDGWIHWKDYYARLRAGEDMRRIVSLYKLDDVLREVYTDERVRALAGAPRGTLVDAVSREIDNAPADEFDAEEITTEFTR